MRAPPRISQLASTKTARYHPPLPLCEGSDHCIAGQDGSSWPNSFGQRLRSRRHHSSGRTNGMNALRTSKTGYNSMKATYSINSLTGVLQKFQPDEVYNLASLFLLFRSWSEPILTGEINALGSAGYWRRSVAPTLKSNLPGLQQRDVRQGP